MSSRRIERLVAAVALLGVGCTDRGSDEAPAALIKMSPTGLRAQGVAAEDAWRLFDRSTSSSIAPVAAAAIEVDLGEAADLAAIKVRGPAPYIVQADGFGSIDLSSVDAGWQLLLAEAPVHADRLSLELTPTGDPGPLAEVEIWAAAHSTEAPASVTATAEPLLAQLSLAESCVDFTVSLERRPEHFRRAYLAYASDGLFRPFSVKRWINGGAEQGGAWVAPGDGRRDVLEEIDPAALRAGDNTVSFCLAEGATRGATLSGVRLVGEFDQGHLAAATPLDVAAGERVVLPFDRLIAPDVLTLSTADAPLSVECLDRAGIAAPLEHATRTTSTGGSATLLDGGDRACAALALIFSSAVSQAEVDVIGSGAAERVDWPRIVVSSEREHLGDRAWVGGYVARPSVMTGAIRLAVDGAASESLTGDFGRLLQRTSDTDAPWSVSVAASFPDGTEGNETVVLQSEGRSDTELAQADAAAVASAPPPPSDPRFGAEGDAATEVIKPGRRGAVRLGSRVGVDLPAGAVAAATKVTVRHLGEDVLPPLDPGMINVTAPARRGYEFLPHGQKFKKKVEVTIPYDPRLIPEGLTPADVHAYFYDPRDERWVKLERAAVDVGDELTRSLTDHFTIMVNAVLMVPENPNPLSFDPTTLSSIAAASPAANIDFVEPPSAASTGEAKLSYPIRLPRGRGSFSPELALQYNSGGGNGWLGVGWDLAGSGHSKIEIDTRFGVPTYAGAEEEVRYLLDGAPIVPTLETDGPECRDGTEGRRYRPRVETDFAHILRCGDRHDNFHFEVRRRDGTLFIYGDEEEPGFLLRASLHNYTHRDGIFAWHLREVVDRHGNRTRYHYTTDHSSGSDSEEQWRIIYPESITYTTHPQVSFAPYKVEFILDSSTRPDPIISGRAGFKMVTRKLLRSIRVSFEDTIVREYILTYAHGQFEKTVLASVRAYGTGGCVESGNAFVKPACGSNLFHEHTFRYNVEEARFAEVQPWLVVDDPDTAHARLNRGKSTSRGGTFALSVDTDVGTFGAQVGRDSGSRAEMVGMYDVNGDGLVDQLYREPDTIVSPSEIIPGELFVLYNQFTRGSSSEGASFFSRTGPELFGLDHLGRDRSKTSSGGLFGAFGGDPVGFSLSAGMSNSVVRAERVVTDVNGDGFVDLVLGEARALLGQPCPEGMCFSETPFGAIGDIEPGEDAILQASIDEIGERLPLGDPVVRWVAPFPGEIRVDATAQKVLAGGEDGVTVVLTQGDDLIEARTLDPDDTDLAVLANGATFQVDTGSTFYLRVRTGADEEISDGIFHDEVDTHLKVTYLRAYDQLPFGDVVDPEASRDPNGRPIFLFDSADDFRVTGAPAPVVAPAQGTIQLRGILAKPVTTADLRACVQRFSSPADPLDLDLDWPCDGVPGGPENISGTFSFAAEAPALQPILESVDVDAGDLLLLRVESDLSFDPVDVRFDALAPGLPRLSYTRVCVPEEDETIVCTSDPETLADTQLLAAHFSPFVPLIDRQPGVARRPYVAPQAGSLRVEPPGQPSEPYLFAIRSDRQGLIHQDDCRQMSCAGIDPPSLTVVPGESITFELLTESGTYSTSLIGVSYGGDHHDFAPLHVRTLAAPEAPRTPLAGGYRNFSYLFWNEKRAFAPTALLEDFEDLEDQSPERRFEIAQSMVAPVPYAGGVSFTPSAAFVAPFSVAFMTATSGHAALVGTAELDENGPSLEEILDGNYARLTTTRSYSAGFALMFGELLSAAFTVALSDTNTTTDVLDLDGDGVSDVVAGRKVRLGDLTGEESFVSDLVVEDSFRYRKGTEYSFGFDGAAAVTPKTTSSGRTLSVDGLKGPDRGRLGLKTGIGFGIGRSETRKDLVDINGDGLPDRVRREDDTVKVSFNLGNHFGTEEVYGQVQGGSNSLLVDDDDFVATERDLKADIGLSTERMPLDHDTTISRHRSTGVNLVLVDLSKSSHQTSTRTTRQVADINGDGLPDLLLKRAEDGFIRVQFNRGSDFGPPMRWETPDWDSDVLPANFDSRIGRLGIAGADVLAATGRETGSERSASVNFIIGSVGGSSSSKTDAYEMSLLDIDGDGSADHVLRRGTDDGTFSFFYVKRNKVSGVANLLRSVERPLGGTFDLEYKMSDATVDMPGRRPLLAKVTVSDGVDLGAAFATPNEVVEFEYRNGFFDRGEKEFLGFREVTTRRADGGRVVQEFENRIYALRGRLVRETRRGADDFNFEDHILTHEVKEVRDASDDPLSPDPACLEALHPLLGSEACLPVFPVVVRAEERRFEKGSGVMKVHVMRDLEHTRFGDVIVSIDEGDGDIASDDVYARASYLGDPSRWIIGLPAGLEVRAGSASGAFLRQRFGLYENGDLVQVSVDTGSGLARTMLSYDAFGNVDHVTTPPNGAGQVQTLDITYDARTHTYPARVVNGFGLASTAEYDLRFGVAIHETDVNGQSMTRTLDGFGRLDSITGPYDVGVPALSFEYFPDAAHPYAIARNRTAAPSGYSGPLPPPITTVTVVDGLGRPIQVRKTAVVDGTLGMTTAGVVRRDALGRVDRDYHPFFTAGVSESFILPYAGHFTEPGYDDLDRPVLTRHPDGATETVTYTIASASGGPPLFRETAVDANGHARETFADQVGRVRAFIEHPTESASSINRYEYSPLGELIGITDAEGNQTELAYDMRGLRTSVSNPDTGLVEERFDLMGNRVALIEPNHRALGVEVRFLHDRDRLTGIDYPSKPDVTYSYGPPGAPFGRAGRIAEVRDETGRVETFYGALGEVVRTVREVNAGNPDKPVRFDTRFVHDSFGRLLRLTYPDGEVVTNTYDDAGQLALVTGIGKGWSRTYASELRYNVFGNRIRARFGNGAVTTWSFDDKRVRLNALTSTLASNDRVQDLRYQYDPAGNPVAITTLLPTPGPSSKLPGGATLSMAYDGVDRLVLAKGTSQLSPSKTTAYEQTFSYSASHNLLGKKRTHLISQPNAGGMPAAPANTNFEFAYTYGARPHEPTRVGDLDIEYDASGNPILRRRASTGRQENLVWDDDGRMVEFQGGSTHQRNTFDAAGLRVVRQGANRTTIFSSPFFDLEGSSQGVKHIFAGDTRVASVLASYSPPLPGASPLPPAKAGSSFYFHHDHLGSTSVLTDERGDVYQHLEYFPDGEIWIDSGPQQPVNGYLFSGKPFDPDTGFSDFGQRFYDPKTSLWLGVDPLLTEGDLGSTTGMPMLLATGAYANQSPLANVDPDGRCVGVLCGTPPNATPGERQRLWRAQFGDHFGKAPSLRRVRGAFKVAAGAVGFVAGAALVETGVGAPLGYVIMGASADVAGSGVGEVVTDEDQSTVGGQLGGPEAQQLEEDFVFAAGGAYGLIPLAAGVTWSIGAGRAVTFDAAEGVVNISTAGRTAEEASAIREYARRSNQWLEANGPQVIQQTQGGLRRRASASARAERLRAARAGTPYGGQAGHVPDTAVTGQAHPPAGWLDMPGVSNNACGGVLGCRVGRTIRKYTVDGVPP